MARTQRVVITPGEPAGIGPTWWFSSPSAIGL